MCETKMSNDCHRSLIGTSTFKEGTTLGYPRKFNEANYGRCDILRTSSMSSKLPNSRE